MASNGCYLWPDGSYTNCSKQEGKLICFGGTVACKRCELQSLFHQSTTFLWKIRWNADGSQPGTAVVWEVPTMARTKSSGSVSERRSRLAMARFTAMLHLLQDQSRDTCKAGGNAGAPVLWIAMRPGCNDLRVNTELK